MSQYILTVEKDNGEHFNVEGGLGGKPVADFEIAKPVICLSKAVFCQFLVAHL